MQRLVVTRPLVPSQSCIEDASERQHYWNALLATWGSKQPHLFPGCNPVSVSKSNLHVVTSKDASYMISLKSDGVRYALFLTMRRGSADVPVALMIDRSGNMYEVEVRAEEAHFRRSTLIEGELVWRQPECSEMLFLAFDAICVKGQSLKSLPFVHRLQRLVECVKWSEDLCSVADEELDDKVLELDAIALTHYDPRIVLRPKTFVERQHSQRLWSERSKSDHRVDGIILQKAHSPYEMGTSKAHTSLKWKKECTVDLEGPLMRSSEGTRVGDLLECSAATVSKSRIEAREGDVVEYLIQGGVGGRVELFAIRKRTDKKYANGDTVVRATFNDFLNLVGVEDIGSTTSP